MKHNFGSFLRKKREDKNLSLRAMAKELMIGPTYLSDMENNKRHAPSKERLDDMLEVLQLIKPEKERFYDLASESKNDIPEDIKEFLVNNKNYYQIVRGMKIRHEELKKEKESE